MIKVIKDKEKLDRVSQGDIFKNVEYLEHVKEDNGICEVSKIIFPYVVILTQDCDLQQDCKFRNMKVTTSQDKLLLSVIVAPLYNSEHVFLGEHLSKLGLKVEPIKKNKTPGANIRSNQNPRYQYIEFSDDIQIPTGIIDFKHYFTVNINYLNDIRDHNWVCQVCELYRESISQRFAYYLSRIGLPNN